MVFLFMTISSSATSTDNIHGGVEQEERRLTNVTCNEGELLLDIKATTGDSEHYDWQVIDDTMGEMFAACPAAEGNETATTTTDSNLCYWTSNKEFHDQVCIPATGGCYRLVISEHEDEPYSRFRTATSLDVRYDVEEIFVGEQFQFKSILLLPKINSQSCDSSCVVATDGSGGGMELELFLFHVDGKNDTDSESGNSSHHEWIIHDKDSGSDTAVIVKDGDRPLTYHRQCISTCAEVRIPSDTPRRSIGMGGQVRVGNIIYGNAHEQRPFPQPLFVGDCTSVCGSAASLFRLDYKAPDDGYYNNDFVAFEPSVIHYPKLRKTSPRVEREADLMSFSQREDFRGLFCIDDNGIDFNEGCTMMEGSTLFSYFWLNYQINGRTIDDWIDCQDPSSREEFLCDKLESSYTAIFIPLNDGCKSNRTILYLVFTALSMLMALVRAYRVCKKRMNASEEEEEEEEDDPPPATTTIPSAADPPTSIPSDREQAVGTGTESPEEENPSDVEQ